MRGVGSDFRSRLDFVFCSRLRGCSRLQNDCPTADCTVGSRVPMQSGNRHVVTSCSRLRKHVANRLQSTAQSTAVGPNMYCRKLNYPCLGHNYPCCEFNYPCFGLRYPFSSLNTLSGSLITLIVGLIALIGSLITLIVA